MSAPGRDVVARCADEFFARSQAADWEGMLALAAPGMTAWASGGQPRGPFADAVPGFAVMREKMGAWEYLHVQRVVSDDSFCEQHTVRFQRPDGTTRDYAACVVGRVDSEGLLISLDEYIDPARPTSWHD